MVGWILGDRQGVPSGLEFADVQMRVALWNVMASCKGGRGGGVVIISPYFGLSLNI